MADTKIGKKFEDLCKIVFDGMRSSSGVFYHRLKDSHSAGRVVSNSPADFLLAFQGQAYLVECKASEKYSSLSQARLSDVVDADQAAYHVWWNSNGMRSFFLFYSDRTGLVEVWGGADVAHVRQHSGKLSASLSHCTLEGLGEALIEVFQ